MKLLSERPKHTQSHLRRAFFVMLYALLYGVINPANGQDCPLGTRNVCEFDTFYSYFFQHYDYCGPEDILACKPVAANYSIDPPEAALEVRGGIFDPADESLIVEVRWDPAYVGQQTVTVSCHFTDFDPEGVNIPCNISGFTLSYDILSSGDTPSFNGGSITTDFGATVTAEGNAVFQVNAPSAQHVNRVRWSLDGVIADRQLNETFEPYFSYTDNGPKTITATPYNQCFQAGPSLSLDFDVDINLPTQEVCTAPPYAEEIIFASQPPLERILVPAACDVHLQAANRIVIARGVTVAAGAGFSATLDTPDNPDEDLDKNWVQEWVYNEQGEVVAESKGFFDALGRPVQSQIKNLSLGQVVATEQLYDATGVAVLSTLPAPITNRSFNYKENFLTTASGQAYGIADFDKPGPVTDPGGRDNPNAVASDEPGTVGWYYSTNNTMESATPITSYPYARQWAEKEPDPEFSKSAGPGDAYRMGAGREVATSSLRTGSDLLLTKYYNWRDQYFIAPDITWQNTDEGYRSTATDPDGQELVTYTDAAGRSVISGVLGENGYEYAFTYYDDLGRVIASVPPKGVAATDPTPWATTYTYNHLGWLLATESPETGLSEFVYDQEGKIRFSQDADQRSLSPPRFSYTLYHKNGRPLESGEYETTGAGAYVFESHAQFESNSVGATSVHTLVDATGTAGALQADRCYEVSKIFYDLPALGSPEPQRFLTGQVSMTENEHVTTYYSYDYEGKLEWMSQRIAGLGVKKVAYAYDFNGNVTRVAYQPGADDEFIHHYTYDADQRLSQVHVSKNGEQPELQATYDYYLHGPLKRMELAGGMQGIDFTYTAQGALKAINHADPLQDPGQDGFNAAMGEDAFGMVLDYYPNDFSSASISADLVNNESPANFNGAIRSMAWHSPTHEDIQGYAYTYDRKNQLEGARWGQFAFAGSALSFTGATAGNNQVDVGAYDAHGNMSTLLRKDSLGNVLHDFEYTYTPNTNKLANVGKNGVPEISYTYNATGQLTRQTEDGTTSGYRYDAYGMLTDIVEDPDGAATPVVTYTYDDRGNRLSQQNHLLGITTWYVRDAGGSVLSIYEENDVLRTTNQTEVPVYGGSRIGIYYPQESGSFAYELSDHLGNVRAIMKRQVTTFTATMEDNGQALYTNPRVQEAALFENIEATALPHAFGLNHTAPDEHVPEPNAAAYLNAAQGRIMGPALAIKVSPGDTVVMEAYGKYRIQAKQANKELLLTDLVGAVTGSYVLAGVEGATEATRSLSGGISALASDKADMQSGSQAYLQYILLDEDLNYTGRFGFDEMEASAEFEGVDATAVSFDKMTLQTRIQQAGVLLVYVSAESPDAEVWFDDMTLTHMGTSVARAIDYYPFGLEMAKADKDKDLVYRFGYQGQYAETDTTSGFNSFQLRQYDARIGRFTTTDPYGQFYSPYVGMGNNPINAADPNGGFSVQGAVLGGLIAGVGGFAYGEITGNPLSAGEHIGLILGGAAIGGFAGDLKDLNLGGSKGASGAVSDASNAVTGLGSGPSFNPVDALPKGKIIVHTMVRTGVTAGDRFPEWNDPPSSFVTGNGIEPFNFDVELLTAGWGSAVKFGARTALKTVARSSAIKTGMKALPSGGKTVKHHIFNVFRGKSPKSQVYRDFFKKHGIDLDSHTVHIPENLHKKIHSAGNNWTTAWKRWIDSNPNATTKQVYQRAGQMMDDFGISGYPILPYK